MLIMSYLYSVLFFAFCWIVIILLHVSLSNHLENTKWRSWIRRYTSTSAFWTVKLKWPCKCCPLKAESQKFLWNMIQSEEAINNTSNKQTTKFSVSKSSTSLSLYHSSGFLFLIPPFQKPLHPTTWIRTKMYRRYIRIH